jgi:hypothetical protein
MFEGFLSIYFAHKSGWPLLSEQKRSQLSKNPVVATYHLNMTSLGRQLG